MRNAVLVHCTILRSVFRRSSVDIVAVLFESFFDGSCSHADINLVIDVILDNVDKSQFHHSPIK